MEDVQRTSAMVVYVHWRFFWQQTLVSLHLCSPMDKCTVHWGKNHSSLWLKLSAICAAVPLLLASTWQDSLYSHLASISIGHLAAGDISQLRPLLIGKYHNWTYALYKPSHFENVVTYSSGHKKFYLHQSLIFFSFLITAAFNTSEWSKWSWLTCLIYFWYWHA